MCYIKVGFPSSAIIPHSRTMSLSAREIELPPEVVPDWVLSLQTGIYLLVALATLVVYDTRKFLINSCSNSSLRLLSLYVWQGGKHADNCAAMRAPVDHRLKGQILLGMQSPVYSLRLKSKSKRLTQQGHKINTTKILFFLVSMKQSFVGLFLTFSLSRTDT